MAVANVPKTGWLPKELRWSGYDGPGAVKAKPEGAPKKARAGKPKAGKPAAKTPKPARKAKPQPSGETRGEALS